LSNGCPMTAHPRSTTFDHAASYYDATRGFPPGIDQQAADLMASAAGISRDSVLLEIGVGTGRLALPLAQRSGPYYGVDLSAEMMYGLNAKRPNYPGGDIRLIQADVMRLPIAAHSIDFAVLVNILHLIPQPQTAMQELERVLKPGGAAICGWDRRKEPTLQALTDAWEQATGDLMRFDSVDTGPETLAKGGWTLRTQAVLEYSSETTANRKADAFRNRICSSMWRLSDEVWQAGVRAIEAALVEHFPEPHRSEPVERHYYVAVYTP
jgi:ubiquinone/menaquinone biosynthesis C-methylase UbiE